MLAGRFSSDAEFRVEGHSLFEFPHLGLTIAWDGWIESMSAEQIAASYKEKGCDFFPDLNGEFVLVIWDSKKNSLVLARDPVGTKQIYYFASPHNFVLSTRLAYFFKSNILPKKINKTAVAQYLAGELLDYDSTFFEGIRQVPPAHFLTVQPGQTPKLTKFWGPESLQIQSGKKFEDYHEEFFDHFKRAVRSRIDQENPTGLLLSGGLDSSQICAMAETIRLENSDLPPVYSACLVPEGFLEEEKELLGALNQKYGCEIETVPYFEKQSHASLFELFQDQGEMPHNDGFLTVEPLMKKFAEKGCKKILTGFGANELSNPFEMGYLLDLLFGMRASEFLTELKRFSFSRESSAAEAARYVFSEALTEKTPFLLRKQLRRQRNQKRAWLREGFKKEIPEQPALRLRPFKSLALNKPYQALFEPLIPSSLTVMNDCARHYGMEVSHPFLDFKLIRFLLSVPASVKIRDGYRKKFIQTALKDIMPVPVKHRDLDTYLVPLPSLENRRRAEVQNLQKHFSNPEGLLFNYLDHAEVAKIMASPAQVDAIGYPMLWRFARLGAWLDKQFK